jgi:hypothetical protein
MQLTPRQTTAHTHNTALSAHVQQTHTATHLDVLSRGDPSEVGAVKLARAGEDHGAGRHVEPDREGLGGEQAFDQALLHNNIHTHATHTRAAVNVVSTRQWPWK